MQRDYSNRGERDQARNTKVLRQLDGLKGMVLNRGTKYLRHFSLDMVTLQSEHLKRGKPDPDPSLGSLGAIVCVLWSADGTYFLRFACFCRARADVCLHVPCH